MYRFGDGTPFPFEENFIDTLLAAVDAAVGAFAAAAELDERRDKANAARKDADDELRRFAVMDKAVEAALLPMQPSADRGATSSQQAAARALAAARHAIGQSRTQVEQRLSVVAAEPRVARASERLRAAMAAFFEHNHLPDTAWRWMWNATGSKANAEAIGFAGKFRGMFDLDLDGVWTQVVRIGAIVPGLEAVVPRRKMFGGSKRVKISLDRCGLIGVERSPDRSILVIREHASKPSPGWRVILRDPERSGVTLVPIDLAGKATGNELSLDGEQARVFATLWETVDDAMVDLLEDRRRLRDLRVGDQPLESINEPAQVGRALLGVLGPLILQIRTRSRGTGELTLKRDIGDGRREELYVPRQVIERKFAMLPATYRRSFEEIGLGRQGTAELVSDDISTQVDAPIRGMIERAAPPPPPPPQVRRAEPPPPPAPMYAPPHAPTRVLPGLPLAADPVTPVPAPRPPSPPPLIIASGKSADALAKLPAVPPTLTRVPLRAATA